MSLRRALRFLPVLLGIIMATSAPIRAAGDKPPGAQRKTAALPVNAVTQGDLRRDPARGSASHPTASMTTMPLSFELNEGQTDPRVKFLSRGQGYTLFLTGDATVLKLTGRKEEREIRKRKTWDGSQQQGSSGLKAARKALSKTKDDREEMRDVVRLNLLGANLTRRVVGLDELPGKVNYFIGNNPKKWQTNVPTYAKVMYRGIYPGIDLVYYGQHGRLECDFVIAPGADPNQIQLAIAPDSSRGTKRAAGLLRLTRSGDLAIETALGHVLFTKPVVYQPDSSDQRSPASNQTSAIGHRQLLDGSFVLLADNRVKFRVASYNPARPLVIDPYVYVVTIGGSGTDVGNAVAASAAGTLIPMTGWTDSANFPVTTGVYQPASGGAKTHSFGPTTSSPAAGGLRISAVPVTMKAMELPWMLRATSM